jgi:IS6 family transposase
MSVVNAAGSSPAIGRGAADRCRAFPLEPGSCRIPRRGGDAGARVRAGPQHEYTWIYREHKHSTRRIDLTDCEIMTYVKVAGRWRYLYRAVDQYGQVIDALLSEQRDTTAARRFFIAALRHGPAPVGVTTDKAGPYLRVLDDLIPAAAHVTEQYGNNPIESDHARLKARMRPMRGLKRLRSAARIAAGHAFVQNLRRGHYELAIDVAPPLRLAAAFTELAQAV